MITTCAGCGAANPPDSEFCLSCSAFLEWDGIEVPDAVTVAASHSEAVAHQPPQEEAERPSPRRGVPVASVDFYCGRCGAGNAAGRRYCCGCGAVVDPPARPPSWWQRHVSEPVRRATRHLRGRDRLVGQRPRRWKRHDAVQRRRGHRLRLPTRIPISRFAIPLMALSLFGIGISPLRATATAWVLNAYTAGKARLHPEEVDVKPASARSNATDRSHPALAAIDQNLTTYWVGRPDTRQIGSTLEVDFATPTDLSALGLVNGAPGKLNAQLSRLRTIEVAMVDALGGRSTSRLEVADTDGFRTYPLAGADVSHVVVTVIDVYPGQESRVPAVTELSFHVMK